MLFQRVSRMNGLNFLFTYVLTFATYIATIQTITDVLMDFQARGKNQHLSFSLDIFWIFISRLKFLLEIGVNLVDSYFAHI